MTLSQVNVTGLGNRLGEFGADKWALYQVSQYCDQLVPDDVCGGQEPRFTRKRG